VRSRDDALKHPSFRVFLKRWGPNGGALLVGGLASLFAWIVIERKLAIIDPRTLPSFDVLRTGRRGLGPIAREALTFFGPVTDAYTGFRPGLAPRAQDAATVIEYLLRMLLLAGGLAGLFVRRRDWYHVLGLLTIPMLYIGGVALGVAVWYAYNADPGLAGRYAMALAPLLIVTLVAAARGKWAFRGLWTFAVLTFTLTLSVTLVG
jgi:hypothetical protein